MIRYIALFNVVLLAIMVWMNLAIFRGQRQIIELQKITIERWQARAEACEGSTGFVTYDY